MLFCLKDGDAFPTEALGLPSRLGPAPVEMPADWFAQRDFERLCYTYPDGSFLESKELRQPQVRVEAFPEEPPIPGPADEQYWLPVLRFHQSRIGAVAFEAASAQLRSYLRSAPAWPDLYQFLQTLRSIPSL